MNTKRFFFKARGSSFHHYAENIHQKPFILAASSRLKAWSYTLTPDNIHYATSRFIPRYIVFHYEITIIKVGLRCPIPFIFESNVWVRAIRKKVNSKELGQRIVGRGAASQLLFYKWHCKCSKSDLSLDARSGKVSAGRQKGWLNFKAELWRLCPAFELTFSTSLKNLTSLDTRASRIKLRIRTNISILIILLVLEGLSLFWYCKSWENKIKTSNYQWYVSCLISFLFIFNLIYNLYYYLIHLRVFMLSLLTLFIW